MDHLTEVGRTHRPGSALPIGVSEDLVDAIVGLFDACAGDLEGMRRYLEQTRVLACPRLSAVFTQYPLDVLLMKLSSRCDLLRTSDGWHDLLRSLAA